MVKHSGEHRILLVDDDVVDRKTVRRLLGPPWVLIEADSAAGVTEQLEEGVDCVLLDYNIPSTDTMALLSELESNSIPVVMLTGEGSEAVAVEAMKRGAKDYLVKGDLSEDSLRRALQGAMEKNALQRELKERQRELEEFAHVASHDLNAPLNKIRMSCEILYETLEGELLSDESKRLMDIAIGGCRQMNTLIKDLLEYSRVGRSNKPMETVALNEVLELVQSNLSADVLESEGTIEVEQLPEIIGDKTALTQLFQNLLSNGLKFRGEEAPLVRIWSERENGHLKLYVKDNGIGIAPEDHPRIFRAFERVYSQSDYPGSGIGLATCKKVVDQHRGNISVESALGEGTMFVVEFPLPDEVAAVE